jgi:hypothetical protein
MVLVTTGRLRPRRSASSGVRDAELGEQLLVGRRLLERVELDAVDVLQQRVAEHDVVGGGADDRRDAAGARALRGAPAALAHDELEASGPGLPHHDWLQQPELADRVLQLGERLLVEGGARLVGVGGDGGDVDLAVLRARHRLRPVARPVLAHRPPPVGGQLVAPAQRHVDRAGPATGSSGRWG